jgi:hypothetical protein
VLSRRPQIADVLRPGAERRFRTGRLLAALGLAAFSSEIAGAARKSGGRNDEARGNSDDRAEKTRGEQESDRKNDSKDVAESKDAKSESGKQDRKQERTSNEESNDQNGSEGANDRGDSSRRNSNSDSTSRGDSSADDDAHRGDRSVRELAQRADEPLDTVPDATTDTPANPNVVIDGIPDTSINDLVVQGNEDVIATVSTSGGFAFARSGDVVAVTGPDGASIIQTGDVTTGTSGTEPTEPPADGGNNNNVDFAS